MMRPFVVLALLGAGCFNPKLQNGVPCASEGDQQCPAGQICADDNRCYDPDDVPNLDAGGGADAPDDALRVVQIAAGGNLQATSGHTCALLNDGRLRCFGFNLNGELGLGNTVTFGDNEAASSAPFVQLGPVASVGAGFDSSCAVLTSGELRCWGSNAHGELGLANNDTDPLGDDEQPTSLAPIDVGGDAVEACGGDTYHCVRLTSGQVRCFGLETNSIALGGSVLGVPGVTQIGLTDRPAQFASINFGTNAITDIDCGVSHACAVNEAGQAFCWGTGSTGALGYPGSTGTGFNEDPIDNGPIAVGGSVVEIATGISHTCARLTTGAVHCWGIAANIGYGSVEDIGDDEPPSAAGAVDLDGLAIELKANGNTTCARLDSGDVRCWGFPNGHTAEPVGDNELPSAFAPLPLPAPAVHIAVGFEHACAILDTNEMYCWGRGASGRLGYGDEEDVGIGTSVTSKGPVPIL